ncbi:hypothetical protein AZ66_29910 [Paenibacillus sp. E194]|nr:hypothetical protein AZ66_29910 [Paenibacillus sp. E194]
MNIMMHIKYSNPLMQTVHCWCLIERIARNVQESGMGLATIPVKIQQGMPRITTIRTMQEPRELPLLRAQAAVNLCGDRTN